MLAKNQKTAVVTGASTGIGYELAKVLAREGYQLLLVARGEARLKKVAEELGKAEILAVDLGKSGAAVAVHEAVKGMDVEILVNNAGFGTYGRFLETDVESELEMLQLNMVALTHLTKLFVADLAKRGGGRILNVASTAAFQPGPGMACYFATKAYVLSLSEALAHELKSKGITVTALCPGATRSEFQSRANMHSSRLVKNGMMEPSVVAEIGYRALMSGKTVVVPGYANRMLARSVGFLPRGWVTSVSARMMDRA